MATWIVTDHDWGNTWEYKTLADAKAKVFGMCHDTTFGKPDNGCVDVRGPLAGSVSITKK